MGRARAPGDKSVTHRALLLAGVADGTSEIHGALRADDCLSTLGVVQALGAHVDDHDGGAPERDEPSVGAGYDSDPAEFRR